MDPEHRLQSENEAPPLGVMPESLWLEQRILSLSSAISRFVENGQGGHDKVIEWLQEAQRHTFRLRKLAPKCGKRNSTAEIKHAEQLRAAVREEPTELGWEAEA